MPPQPILVDKTSEIQTSVASLLRSYEQEGFGHEAAIAAANALQEFLANNWPHYQMPHGQSAETFMRIVACLLDRPNDKRYCDQKLELGLKIADNEFALLAERAQKTAREPKQKGKYKLEMIDGGLVPIVLTF